MADKYDRFAGDTSDDAGGAGIGLACPLGVGLQLANALHRRIIRHSKNSAKPSVLIWDGLGSVTANAGGGFYHLGMQTESADGVHYGVTDQGVVNP
jgi:hypothetical protein